MRKWDVSADVAFAGKAAVVTLAAAFACASRWAFRWAAAMYGEFVPGSASLAALGGASCWAEDLSRSPSVSLTGDNP